MMDNLKEALNKAAATLCGRVRGSISDKDGFGYFMSPEPGCNPCDFCWLPDYCEDHNALPELWKSMQERGHLVRNTYYRKMFTMLFPYSQGRFPQFDSEFWRIQLAPPLLHVIAVLKACNAWTPELEAMYEKEKKNESVDT